MNFAIYSTYIDFCFGSFDELISSLKLIQKQMSSLIHHFILPIISLCLSKQFLFLCIAVSTSKINVAKNANVSFKLGNGMTVTDADSSMSFNLSLINQDRIDVAKVFIKNYKPTVSAQIQRLRLRTRATFFHNKLLFALQLGFEPREVKKGRVMIDAYLRYTPIKYVSLQIGQANLPGNRESMTSAHLQQFIDRSPTSALFRSDKDFSFQVHGNFGKKMLVKPIVSIATGEGRNYTDASFQHFDYMARVEWLPLGNFNSYSQVNFSRDINPKLALGLAYDFNHKAIFQYGQMGGNTIADSAQKSIHTVYADLNFQWRGLNINSDYVYRAVKKDKSNLYKKGHSFYVAAGYTFKKHYDVAFRYNHSFAGKHGNIEQINDYTIAFTKYFFEHNLKIQTDYTISDNKTKKQKSGIWRMQFQIII